MKADEGMLRPTMVEGPEASDKKQASPAAIERTENRRQSPRRPMRLGVRFGTTQELSHAMRAYTKNIGLGGLCLLTQRAYQPGVQLELTIELGAGEVLKVDAAVAWARPGTAVGVRFVALDDAQRERLQKLMAEDAPPPSSSSSSELGDPV